MLLCCSSILGASRAQQCMTTSTSAAAGARAALLLRRPVYSSVAVATTAAAAARPCCSPVAPGASLRPSSPLSNALPLPLPFPFVSLVRLSCAPLLARRPLLRLLLLRLAAERVRRLRLVPLEPHVRVNLTQNEGESAAQRLSDAAAAAGNGGGRHECGAARTSIPAPGSIPSLCLSCAGTALSISCAGECSDRQMRNKQRSRTSMRHADYDDSAGRRAPPASSSSLWVSLARYPSRARREVADRISDGTETPSRPGVRNASAPCLRSKQPQTGDALSLHSSSRRGCSRAFWRSSLSFGS